MDKYIHALQYRRVNPFPPRGSPLTIKYSIRQSKITKCSLLAALGGKWLKRVSSMIRKKNVLLYFTIEICIKFVNTGLYIRFWNLFQRNLTEMDICFNNSYLNLSICHVKYCIYHSTSNLLFRIHFICQTAGNINLIIILLGNMNSHC